MQFPQLQDRGARKRLTVCAAAVQTRAMFNVSSKKCPHCVVRAIWLRRSSVRLGDGDR